MADRLRRCPLEHMGGQIERRNELGGLQLSAKCFPRAGSITMGYGASEHQVARRWLDDIFRLTPTRATFLSEVHAFLRPQASFKVLKDVSVWWQMQLWKHLLHKAITRSEAKELVTLQSRWLQQAVTGVPRPGLKEAQDKYHDLVLKNLPTRVPEEHKDLVAETLLHAFVFAGGLSVPQTIQAAIAVLCSPEIFTRAIDERNVQEFVLEVTRLFPAVQFFPLWRDGRRELLSLNAALRDPKAWGKESHQFTLKPQSIYADKHVGFANQAEGHDFHSKCCPGRALTFAVVEAFVLALGPWAAYDRDAKAGDSRPHAAWHAVKLRRGKVPQWWKTFKMKRIVCAPLEKIGLLLAAGPRNETGDEQLEKLQPAHFQALVSKFDNEDGLPDELKKMSLMSRRMWHIVKYQWKDKGCIQMIDPPRHAPKEFTDKDSIELDYIGVRLPFRDEQFTGLNSMQERMIHLLKALSLSWTGFNDDPLPELLVQSQEQRQQAIVLGKLAFRNADGRSRLPATVDPWKDITADNTQWQIAKAGIGQLYLAQNRDPTKVDLGELVCDCSALTSLAVRPAFERLGARAYFKKTIDGEYEITAVDLSSYSDAPNKRGCRMFSRLRDQNSSVSVAESCNNTITKADKRWEHAKFVWRSSVFALCTIRDHLVWSHWTSANAFTTSMRETLDPTHPVRRVLHVNQFNTARINYQSYLTLYPEGAFLHQISGFTYDSLSQAFANSAQAFRYETWPQFYERVNLDKELKDELPIFQDGLLVWNALHEFYFKYVDLYYSSDAEVCQDKQLQDYWKFKRVPAYTRGLPELSKKALVDQMTKAVFDVTAGHQFVGNVQAYLTDPAGVCLQIRSGHDMADRQAMLNILNLQASTGSPMPKLMSDWFWLFDPGEADKVRSKALRGIFQELLCRLNQVSETVKQNNTSRMQTCSLFDPEGFETSVSL